LNSTPKILAGRVAPKGRNLEPVDAARDRGTKVAKRICNERVVGVGIDRVSDKRIAAGPACLIRQMPLLSAVILG
jgi:hypothetical protein